jgi:Protein of unknown function (DUF4239)
MSPVAISLIVFGFVFGGALCGVLLRSVLPPHHLSSESKEMVTLGMGLVATTAALVLGLLIASAKSSFDAQSGELTQMSANIVFLDRVLRNYGPEAKETRTELRDEVLRIRDRMWPKDHSVAAGWDPESSSAETLYIKIQQLSPKDNTQTSLQAQALSVANTVGQTRWLMYEQNAGSVPFPLLAVLVSWLTIIFISFGLFAPRNATVVVSLLVSALSISCAILLILEMYSPFQGVIQISSAPLNAALAHLGK